MAKAPLSPVEELLSEQPAAGLPAFKFSEPERSPVTSGSSASATPTNLQPLFESAAQKYNVPVNVLLGLADQESRFNTKAVGQQTQWGRAKGLMQYLDSTAAGMGINPYDPAQSIDAAAKQIRQRLDKGYDMIDAVREHFAGPDRKKWGEKTARYGDEVMARAAKFGGSYQPSGEVPAQDKAPSTSAPSPLTIENQQKYLVDQLNTDEPGRYSIPTPEQLAGASGSQPAADLSAPKADRSYWDRLTEATGHGYDDMTRSLGNAQWALGGGDTSAIAKGIADNMKLREQLQGDRTEGQKRLDAAIKKVDEDAGFWNTTANVGKAIGTAVMEPGATMLGAAESAASMLPSLATGAAGAGAGAGVGAGIGAAAGGVGAAPGAVIGAGWGFIGGSAVGTTAVELGAEMEQMVGDTLQKEKMAPTQENIQAILERPGFREEARNQGLAKGLTVSAVDALTLKLGGRVATTAERAAERRAVAALAEESGVTQKAAREMLGTEAGRAALEKAAPTTTARLAAGAGAFGVELAGEPASEAASQLVARGEITGSDVVAEGIYGAGQAAAHAGIAHGIEGSAMAARRVAGAQSAEAAPSVELPAEPAPVEAVSEAPPVAPAEAAPAAEPAAAPAEQPIATDPMQPVADQAAPAGPLGRAMQRAEPEQQLDMSNWLGEPGTAVQIQVPGVDPFAAVIEGYAEGEVLVRDQEGNSFQLDKQTIESAAPIQTQASADIAQAEAAPVEAAAPAEEATPYQRNQLRKMGVPDDQLENLTKEDAGSILNAQEEAATQEKPKEAPARERAPERSYSDMNMDELNDRLAYVKRQAKMSGWDKRLVAEREKIATAKRALLDAEPKAAPVAEPAPVEQPATAPAAEAQTETATEQAPAKWFGSQEKAAAYIEKKGLGDTHEIRQNDRRFEVVQKAEAAPATTEESSVVQTDAPEVGQTLLLGKGRNEAKVVAVKGDRVQVSVGGNVQAMSIKQFNRRAADAVEAGATEQPATAPSVAETETAPAVEQTSQQEGVSSTDAWRADMQEALDAADKEHPQYRKLAAALKGRAPAAENYRQVVLRQAREIAAPAAEQQAAADLEQAAERATPAVSQNTLVTDARAEELRKRLKAKLSQLNSGIDPEILAIGTELAVYHVERGARTFAAFARRIADDLGVTVQQIRPYLRSWYNGSRDMIEDMGGSIEGMDSPETVRAELAKLASEEANDEPAKLGQPGESALAGTPAGDGPRAEGEGAAGQRAQGSRGADARGNERAGSVRDDDARGLGDDAGEVPVPARGAERGRAAGERSRAPVQRSDAGDAAGRGADASRVAPASGTVAEQRGENFTITEADEIGSGGQKTKFKRNVEAIRLLKQLESEGRQAAADEQAVLAKFVGWGGLPQAFHRSDKGSTTGWAKEVAELKSLLSDEEYRAAESSTKNAHYTSPEIVSGLWNAMQRLGFTGGKVLEPSVGVGNFFGLMPAELRGASALNGVELDPITGGIAKQLYPQAKIAQMGFQDYLIPDNHFDIAIGNPPFGRESLYDGKRKDLSGFSIHNYFFAKSLDALRPGGVMAMVVTNRMMDVPGDKARRYIDGKADLLAAIRLPNDAFAKNAGTEVTTDIIFLRKREIGELPGSYDDWMKVVDHVDANGKTVPLNEYFAKNPQNMLGDFGAYGSMYSPEDPALVKRPGQDTAAELAQAIARLPEGIMGQGQVQTITPQQVVQSVRAESVRVGSMFVDGDQVLVRGEDTLGETQAEPVTFPSEKARDRVVGMIGMRDLLADVRRLQLDPKADDRRIEAARARLNKAYDAFVKENGPINLDANKRLFRDDPTWPQLSALEDGFDKGISAAVAKRTGEQARKPSAQKAAIFSKRTQSPYRPPEAAKSAKDALVSSLAEVGRVDMPMMSRLYGQSEDAIAAELGDLIYQDPGKGYVTSDEYLSGNVKAKLAQARRAAADNPAYQRNVEALEAVQPADIEAVDINVKPGAVWVPQQTMADFADHLAEAKGARAFLNPATAKWGFPKLEASAAARQRWATSRVTLEGMLEATANQKAIQVYDTHTDGSRTLNETETQLANDKAREMRQEWNRWIWADDSRREQLSRLYNDIFNTNVPRRYDGSHLTFPGKVGDDIIKLRPHQANAVWRAIQGDPTLFDHVVGAGKTFTAIAAIMEKRRMGLAKKPMLVVPNHLVGQWAADFVKLYPGANVLAASKADFAKENRKRLFARIATGDWDAVIVAHSSFGKVEVEPKEQAAFIEEQVADLESSIELMRTMEGKDSRNVKDVVKRRDALREKLKKLFDSEAKDDSLYWGELGIDDITVDEAHEFKNLAFSTSMNRVAGLGNQQGSQKAADMYLKVQQVLKATGGRNVTFATGTPISNTMAEMYTMQRYLDGANLKAQGLAHFDAWARMFGEVVTDWELSPSGAYKLNSRFAKFVNMPELMQRYTSFADVINRDDINRMLAAQGKKLPVPKVVGGKPTNIVVGRSPAQATYIGEPIKDAEGNDTDQYPVGSLVWRAENLPKKAEKGSDNMLKIMSDARKAALDMRLIDPDHPDFPGSKVNRAADEIVADYDRWKGDRGTQLVFIDLSTPKGAKAGEAARIRDLMERAENGDDAAITELDKLSPDELSALDGDFSVYDDLKSKLIARGIPENEIAFIHDANTELQKEDLFGKVRSGRVRVLFGSTAKMGAGMNVQDRLTALHHLDAPWRPSDLEQREGRIIRQGNKLYERDPEGFEVRIHRYATKQTLDSRMWQTIEGKANFIEQVRKGNTGTREIEDVSGEAANAAEMKAASSGNPLILEEMSLRQKIRTLETERAGHDREQHRLRDSIRSMERQIDFADQSLAELRQDAKRAQPQEFAMTIDGQEFDKRKDAGEALLAQAASMEAQKEETREIGRYGDFTLHLERIGAERFEATLEGAGSYAARFDLGNDPMGAVQRIVNTVRDLPAAIERAQESKARAQRDIPRLKEQATSWKKEGDLKEANSRHAEVLEQLKPKKTTQTAPAEAAQPKKNSIGDAASLRETLNAGDLGPALQKLIAAGKVVLHDTAPDGSHRSLQGWTEPDGTIHLVADQLTADRAQSVLLHEAFHSGSESLMGTDRWMNLMARLNGFYKAGEAGRLTGDWKAAFERVQNAQAQGDAMSRYRAIEELGAYAVENYERAPAGIQKWVDGILGAVKEWLYRRLGIQVGDLTPAQLRAVAAAALRDGQFKASADVNETRQSIAGPTEKEVDGWFSRKLTDAMAGAKSKGRWSILSTAPMDRMVEELAKDNAPAQFYMEQKRAMDAYRVRKHTEFDKISTKWLWLNTKDRKSAKAMANLMHESTISQVDPSERFRSIITKADQQLMDYKPASEDAQAAFAKKVRDDQRREDHARLKAEFDALPEAYQEQYRLVRDTYGEMAKELDQILMDNMAAAIDLHGMKAERRYKQDLADIKDEGLAGDEKKAAEGEALRRYNTAMTKLAWNKKARMTKMRQQFESNRLEGPYFPLARFGDYFVTVRDKDSGEVVSFSRFENNTDQQRFAAQARRTGDKVQTGLLSSSSDVRGSVDPRFVADVEEILSGSEVNDQVKDQVWQRYLETMPDLSMRKGFIHRKNRTGYDTDALRAFGSRMFHGAHQMGRLKYSAQMQEALEQAREAAGNTETPERDTAIVNEMERRHQYVMNPQGGPLAQKITSAAFIYHLSMSPAAALVNTTQTVILGVPVMGAKYGTARVTAALGKAVTDFGRGVGRVERSGSVTEDERKALRDAYDTGIIESTQSHSLAGIGENGVEYSALRNKVMGIIGWQFHQAERFNREVTFLAAYRLARADGRAHEQAVDDAGRMTYKVHFDYSNTNRPRVMHGDTAKVFLVFRNFQINMIYRLFRDIHQVVRGNAEARKEALYQLSGIMGMMALNAGLRGVPFYGAAMLIGSMFFGEDAEDELKKGVVDTLGTTLGGMVLNGVPGHLTGTSLSGRIGMGDLWFRSSDRQLEGQDQYDYWMYQLLGAAPGIVQNGFRGWDMVSKGNVARGIETASPKFIKDIMRTVRYAEEGATTLKGEALVKELKPVELVAQALGFTPAVISEQYERNNALKNAEQRILTERRRLLDRFALAHKSKDDDAKAEAKAKISEFNKKHREVAITGQALSQSLKSRAKNSARTEDGLLLNPKLNKSLRENLGEPIYR